jgi:general secretion pathway protein I
MSHERRISELGRRPALVFGGASGGHATHSGRPWVTTSGNENRCGVMGQDLARVRGFSLIEMLVAMVVLSLSLGVLYQAAIGATRNVRVAAEYTEAVMLAESMLADNSYITDEAYSNAGRFGQYDWVVNSWPAPLDDGLSPKERGMAPQALQHLQVVVSWPGRNTPRTLDLLTVVPLRESLE